MDDNVPSNGARANRHVEEEDEMDGGEEEEKEAGAQDNKASSSEDDDKKKEEGKASNAHPTQESINTSYLDTSDQNNMSWEERAATLETLEFTNKVASTWPDKDEAQRLIRQLTSKAPCPLCRKAIHKPVAVEACWHVFCALCLIEYAREHAKCPLCEECCFVRMIVMLDVKLK